MAWNIFVCGSMAYDRIMDFPGRFADHIMPDKIHMLSVSFTVNDMIERPGGTAGNIAYALALLGEKPTILATIGHDYQRYFSWLAQHGISNEGIKVIDDQFTACAHITTDLANNQITSFNPGAMKRTSDYDLARARPEESMMVIGAGNVDDMTAYRDAAHSRGIDFIFDPSQSLPIWPPEELARCLEGARVLIGNDYEMEMIMNRTGLSKSQLLDRTDAVITTKGEQGSDVATRDGEVHVPAVALPEPPVDPTGAGDAYRGGLIKGLVSGDDLVESARLGAVCASFAVQSQGTQTYTFDERQLQARYAETFSGG